MLTTRWFACGMVLSLSVFGCSRGLPPEGESATNANVSPGSGILPISQVDLATPVESIDLAELLNTPRAILAVRCEELEKTIRRQEQFRREGQLHYSLLPDLRLPLLTPVFREATFSSDRGFSLPPYVKVDGHDSAVAFHLARHGDVDAANKLLEPGDENTAKLIREVAPEKAYPVEWTRLVALYLHSNQIALATDNKDGAKNMIGLHKQLRDVLDEKARTGPLGAALLGKGFSTLKLAAAAWKANNRGDLDLQIKSFLASAENVPAYTVTLPRQVDDLARVFGVKAGPYAVLASSPGRVADLLNIYVPTDEADTCVAFGDDAKTVHEVLFTYRPNLFDYHTPAQFAQPLDDLLAGRQDDVSSDCPRRVWALTQGTLDVTLTPRHATLGAIVRVQIPGTTRVADLSRDFGTVHLDRSYEANRRLAAWKSRGASVTLAKDVAAALWNPLKTQPLAAVVIEREPKHDLVSQVRFDYADNPKDATPAAGSIARPLFASAGRPTFAFGEAGTGQIDFVWTDAKTRYRLRFPYSRDKMIALDAADASASSDLAVRAALVADKDTRDRLERLQAKKPLSVVPRQIDGIQLGISRIEFKKSLPKSAQLAEREIPGGVMVAFLGTPQPPADFVPREWFARFDNDKLVELRIRYVDLPSNKAGTFGKKLDALKAKLGAPDSVVGSHGNWADLPKRGSSNSHSWHDDITKLTCQSEPYGLELTLRDCPAESPAGAPLPGLAYLGRGTSNVTIGMSKDALLKLGAKPAEGNGYSIAPGDKDAFDAVLVWLDDDKVSRIVARHKLATPLKTESQASKALLEQWVRDSRAIGWPHRQDMSGQNLQSLASRDDNTRFRLFWQDEPHGVSVFSEWMAVK